MRLYTPVAVAFLLYVAWQARFELIDLVSRASVGCLLLTVLLWSALHLIMPLFAATMLSDENQPVTWRAAVAIHIERLPARYVPGGIWHTVGRVVDYRNKDVAAGRLSHFVILESGMAALLALAIGGAIVWATPATGPLAAYAGPVAIAAAVTAVVLPFVLKAVSIGVYARCIAVLLVYWLVAAAAFVAYVYAYADSVTGFNVVSTGGVYLFSWGIGFLAIFAPQGIGVFEVVASSLLQGPVGFLGLTALLAGFRFIVLVADLLTWLVFRLFTRPRPAAAS